MSRRLWHLVPVTVCVLAAALTVGCISGQRAVQSEPVAKASARLLALETGGPNARGACDAVAALLDSPHPVVRWQAAALLGTWAAVANPSLAMPALASDDPLVRSLAQEAYPHASAWGRGVILVNDTVFETERPMLTALAELYSPAGYTPPTTLLPSHVEELRVYLDGDAATAVLAADLLARIGDAGARRVLTEQVSQVDGAVLAKIAQAAVRDRMNLGSILLPQAFAGDTTARLGVVRALVCRPDPQQKDLLLSATKDANPVVRSTAIRALGNLGAAAPVDALAAILANRSTREKLDALEALGVCGGEGVAVLRKYLADGPRDDVLRVAAIRAVAPHATREDIGWLTNELKSPNKFVRATAAGALGEIAHPAAQEALIGILGDAEPLVRASAAGALGKIGTVYACEVLLKTLDDASPLVASQAAWGLGEARYVDGVAALAKVADQPVAPPPATKPTAWRLGESLGVPQLAAIGALGKIGTDEAKAVLVKCLDAKCPIVRMTAAQALGASGQASEAVQAALEAHLTSDACELVRAASLLSLEATGKTYPAGYFQGK